MKTKFLLFCVVTIIFATSCANKKGDLDSPKNDSVAAPAPLPAAVDTVSVPNTNVRNTSSSSDVDNSDMFSKGYDDGYAAGVARSNYYEHTSNASEAWQKDGNSGMVNPSFERGWNAGYSQGHTNN